MIGSALCGLRARADGGDTVLAGVLADQAARYGVLAGVGALGLKAGRGPPPAAAGPAATTLAGWRGS
jgi:hypothetical protein